jgi:carbonic anhydrase/acetyltransferase-like protein (isoleucine patch superfamily)
VLIGINAVVLNDAVVRAGSVVAAGAVVSQGFEMGPLQMAAGVPAKIKKTYDPSQMEHNIKEAGIYVGLARDYMAINLKTM